MLGVGGCLSDVYCIATQHACYSMSTMLKAEHVCAESSTWFQFTSMVEPALLDLGGEVACRSSMQAALSQCEEALRPSFVMLPCYMHPNATMVAVRELCLLQGYYM